MNKWAKWFNKGCFLAIGILLGSNYSYAFQQFFIENSLVSERVIFTLPDTSGIIGNTLTMDLVLSNPTDYEINSFQFGISYDTAMVRLEGFSPNQEVLANSSYIANDSIPGLIYFSAASANEIILDGLIAHIQFKLKKAGETNVHLIDAMLNEGVPISHTSGGKLIINNINDVYPPTIPINFQGSLISASSVRLDWFSGDDLDLRKYNIYAKKDSVSKNWNSDELETPWNLEGVDLVDSVLYKSDTPINQNIQFTINELNNLTYYYFWVTSIDTIGNESKASYLRIRTGDKIQPTPPENLIQIIKNRSIELRWLPSLDKDISKYRIYRGSDSLNVKFYSEVSVDETEFVDYSLNFHGRVFYRVTSIDSSYLESGIKFDPELESDFSNSTPGFFVDIEAPGKPEILSIQSSNNSVQFSWEGLKDLDLSYYIVYKGTNENKVSVLDSLTKDTNEYLDITEKNGQVYYYYVSGVDTAGNEGEWSDLIIGSPYNLAPKIEPVSDLYLHNQFDVSIALNYSFQAIDLDGKIDSTLWFINGEFFSNKKDVVINANQGANHILMVAIDDDKARDSTDFSVYVDFNYTELDSALAPDTGLSLFGNDFTFQPDGKGNLNLVVHKEVNQFNLSAPLRSLVSVANDSSFYLIAGSKTIHKYSLENWWKHKITIPMWTSYVNGNLQASAVLDENRKRIYLASTDNVLFSYDMKNGGKVWNANLMESSIHPGVIIDGKYLAQSNVIGEVYYFDLDAPIKFKEMEHLTKTIFNDSLLSSLALDYEGRLVAAFSSGNIRKWDPNLKNNSTPFIVWETNLGGKFNTSPVINEEGNVLIGGLDSTFYSLNNLTGQIDWSFKASDRITSTASINKYGVVYFGDNSGKFYALDYEGNLIWDYQVPHETVINQQVTASESILNTINYLNGVVYFGTQGGKLISIWDGWRYDGTHQNKIESEWQIRLPQWATYQGNYQRTGNVEAVNMTSNEVIEALPLEFKLLQNYPNPFNPTTQIEFSISENAKVKLDIINMLGQNIVTLKDEYMLSGHHNLIFDASDLSSGVYYYRLTAGQYSQIQKMLLIK